MQVLEGHSDEIWHVVFSHDGRLVGSAAKDGAACVWRVKGSGDALLLHTLQCNTESLSCLAFSPDDALLLTCGVEAKVGPCSAAAHGPCGAGGVCAPAVCAALHLTAVWVVRCSGHRSAPSVAASACRVHCHS